MIDALLRSLSARAHLTRDEVDALSSAFVMCKTLPAHATITRAGEPLTRCMAIVSGWAARTKCVKDGRRQISKLYLPGDVLELSSLQLGSCDQDIETLTQCTVACATHHAMRRFPSIANLLWLLTTVDSAIACERIISLGRRDALQRIAHFLCELHARLSLVGLAEHGAFPLPLTQSDLADCMGLTAVHANRMLMTLRQRRLILIINRQVRIQDFATLARLGSFNPDYLHIQTARALVEPALRAFDGEMTHFSRGAQQPSFRMAVADPPPLST